MEGDGIEKATAPARKLMVVADPTRESAAALQYTLSHAILENDSLILLHVNNPNAWKNTFGALLFNKASPQTGPTWTGGGGTDVNFLEEMINICKMAQPKMEVMSERVEMDGKDKASVVLAQCATHAIDILVIGQKNRFANAILGRPKRGGSLRSLDTAEYLVENSKCTCVGVQKKGQNAGYVLNTKTHKNFWLLA